MQALRKTVRFMFIVLLVMILFPATGYVLLTNKHFQQYIINTVTERLSTKLNAEVSIASMKLSAGFTFTLNDICIKYLGDTIISSNQIKTRLSDIDLKQNIICLGNTEVVKAYLFLKEDSTGVINLNALLAPLEEGPVDTTGPESHFSIENIRTHSSAFRMQIYDTTEYPGVDYSDMYVSAINANLNNFRIIGRSFAMNVTDLSCIEKSGFMINKMDCSIYIDRQNMKFEEVIITTPYSNVKAPKINFLANSFREYIFFMQKVELDYEFKTSVVGFRDLAYFSPGFDQHHDKIRFSGNLNGTIADFRTKKLNVKYGKNTHIILEGSVNGLPKTINTYAFLNITKLQTNYEEISNLLLSFDKNTAKSIPPELATLGIVQYKGNFAGFINDFVSYGRFDTDAGVVQTDIMLKPQGKQIVFQGNIGTQEFDMGRLLQNTSLGKVDMDVRIDGITGTERNSLNATIDADIASFVFNQYAYKDIDMKGELTSRAFQGLVNINDPNIQLDFTGNLNFEKEIPEHHFLLDINHADLFALGFVDNDSVFNFGCKVSADFNGNNIDNLNGSVNFENIVFIKKNRSYLFNNAILSVSSSSDTNITEFIEFNSDIIDIKLSGRYDFQTLYNSFEEQTYHYLPHLFENTDSIYSPIKDNHFTFTVFVKNCKEFTDFFIPKLEIAENTFINGSYNPLKHSSDIAITGNYLSYGDYLINNLTFSAFSNYNSVMIDMGCDKFSISDQYNFDRLYISNFIQNNTIKSILKWKDVDSSVFREQLIVSMAINRDSSNTHPIYHIENDSSRFYLFGEAWKINQSDIVIDTSSIRFNRCRFERNMQSLDIAGVISKCPNDTLTCLFKDVELSVMNLFINEADLKLGGIVNGKAQIFNLYDTPKFFSNLKIKETMVNEIELSDCELMANWINDEKKIKINAIAGTTHKPILKIDGNYYPSEYKMDFDIDVNKLKIKAIGWYLKGILSNLDGFASGKLTLSGKADDPQLNGQLNIQRGSFLVDYLQTTYTFTSPVTIQNNRFTIKNAIFNDSEGAEALVQASLTAKQFTDFSFDLAVDADKFLFLDTKVIHNPYFYGKAIGTGIVKISGTTSDILIDIKAKTNKNTILSIPLVTGDIEEKSFITFISKENQWETKKPAQTTEPSSYKLLVNMNIEATPEAIVEIILDPVIGDALTARGNGNIRIEMDYYGKFDMYGRYEIDEGDYTFNLKNLISKKLTIEKGGYIEWQGDPLDALIDIKTIYRTRAALSGIIADPGNQYSSKIPVECWLYLSGKLLNPNIRYDIALPSASEESRSLLKNALNTETEVSRQFLALVVANTFIPDPTNTASGTSNSSASIDILSSQINSLLSGNLWDIGVRMGGGSWEVGMSRQLLNDRVSISGNFDYYTSQSNANDPLMPVGDPYLENKILGDINLDVKISEDGKFRFKAFNRANDQYSYNRYDQALHKQGVSLVYQEEFNNVSELFKNYWNHLLKKENKDSINKK